MCLQRITQRIEKPTDEVVKVWKTFNYNTVTKKLNHPFRNYFEEIPFDTWRTAKEVKIRAERTDEIYTSGFHCYLNKEDALKHITTRFTCREVVLEVHVRQVHTYGTQWAAYHHECLVAKEIFIPKQEIT